MIITLSGHNNFALRRRLDELIAKFAKEHGDLALERIDAEEADGQSVIDAVQSLPFLAAKKMVVLREPSANKDTMDKIEQIISSTGETTELIIYEPTPDKRTAYFKVLQKQTKLENFNELDARELAKWLTEEAERQGGELSLADAIYLVERAGTNQNLLAGELDKLLLFDKQVSKANINLLTEATPQSKIFDLLDAAFSSDKKRALKLYEEQRAQKVEPQAILAMLSWQLQTLVTVKLGEGKPAAKIASDTGMKPYPINKAAGLVRKIDNTKLKKMVDGLFEMDLRSKTTSINLDEALKTYIVTL